MWFRAGGVNGRAGIGGADEYITLEELAKLCERESGGGRLQANHLRGFRARSDVARLQFHVVGRNGTDVVYENCFHLGGQGSVRSWNNGKAPRRRRGSKAGLTDPAAEPPAPVMSTDRVRLEESALERARARRLRLGLVRHRLSRTFVNLLGPLKLQARLECRLFQRHPVRLRAEVLHLVDGEPDRR